MLNHEDPQQAGFFISADNAAAVNFQPTPEWQSHDAYFMSGALLWAIGASQLVWRFCDGLPVDVFAQRPGLLRSL
ncbi:DUF5895 domain-containing protein [Acaryochloris sp. CCMEE 5410]|uniref:DUF5895 domain-containing protein n=1 Tax=Acaryochloris sp. CCMEE 5410 TaxID=310037 RepID=UPI0021CF5BEE|nr:DUF5895 domain-containing protein [Acaryochloris sp. CCMEE 5410]